MPAKPFRAATIPVWDWGRGRSFLDVFADAVEELADLLVLRRRQLLPVHPHEIGAQLVLVGDKYSAHGYIRLWIAGSPNEKKLNELRNIISQPQQLRALFDQMFAEETENDKP